MENVIIAAAAVILVGIQAHRNFLMIQASKKGPAQYQIHLDPVLNLPAPELSIDVQPSQVTVESLIDYDRLESIIEKLVSSQIKVLPQPTYIEPTYIPQYPTYFPVVSDATNDVEIEGVKGKQFPAR